MCGICVTLYRSWDFELEGLSQIPVFEQLKANNTARGTSTKVFVRFHIKESRLGPDRQNTIRTVLPTPPTAGSTHSHDSIILDCFASELQLRGNATVTQPHIEDGNILCWNGEVSTADRLLFPALTVCPGKKIFDGLEVGYLVSRLARGIPEFLLGVRIRK